MIWKNERRINVGYGSVLLAELLFEFNDNLSFVMKRLILVIVIFIGVCVDSYAQNVVKHVVKRGETLSSIAKQYGTTEDRIKELNKNVSNFLYVGMELNVERGNTVISNSVSDIKPTYIKEEKNANVDEEDIYDGWVISMEIGYGFLDHLSYSSAFAYEVSAGVNYYFSNLYCGARVGYLGANYYSRELDTEMNLLVLPTEVGYALGGHNFAVIPYGGFNFDMGLNGKHKIRDYGKKKIDISGDFGVSLRLGLRIRLWGYDLSASYIIPINDEQKRIFNDEPYFGITLGFGF